MHTDDENSKNKKRKLKTIETIDIPENSDLCFYFPDGGSFAGVVKLAMGLREDGNFFYSREIVTFIRSNVNKTILAEATWMTKKILLKGDTNEIPESGFTFGVNIKKFHTLATRTLTKNDMMLMYFKQDNSSMYIGQTNHKTTNASRNETQFENMRLPNNGYTPRIIGQKGHPNIIVRAEEFFIQTNLLATAKCARITIRCTLSGIKFLGEDKEGRQLKIIDFGSMHNNAKDDVTFSIVNKQLKTINCMRNVSRPDSEIRIFFENDKPLLLMCDIGPPDNNYGNFKLMIRDEKK